MIDLTLIEIVGIMIVAGAAALLVLRLFNVPSIVVYIVVGLLLGAVVDVVPEGAFADEDPDAPAETLGLIADLGVALLLFLVGLELSFQKIRDVGRISLLAGFAQVIVTGVGGMIVSLLIGFPLLTALFIGVALTNSSTVLAVKLLEQKAQIHHLHGHIAVGMNLAKDFALILAVTFVGAIGPNGGFDLAEKGGTLLIAFLGLGVMLLVALLAARYILPRPFNWAARSPHALLIWSLAWCFAYVVGSEAVGLSPAIGAFIAGISLAQLDCANELRRRVHPLMNFFLAIFFIAIGAQMDIAGLAANLIPAIVLSLYVLISIPFLCTWLIARFGYSERTSFLAGLSMAQVSELAFVFAAVGLAAGVIDQQMLSLIAFVGLITIVVSSYGILYNDALYAWVRRRGLLKKLGASPTPEPEPGDDELQGHVVVVGMNALGRRIVRELHDRGEKVLAIDTDPQKLIALPGRRMTGSVDHPSLVEEAGIPRARLVVSALQIEDTNRMLAYRCRQMGVPVAIHAFDDEVVDDLRELNVDYMIDSKAEGSRRLEQTLAATEEGGPASA